jgi:hypothetical protein
MIPLENKASKARASFIFLTATGMDMELSFGAISARLRGLLTALTAFPTCVCFATKQTCDGKEEIVVGAKKEEFWR